MPTSLTRICLLCTMCLSYAASGQQPSKLNSGSWHKLGVQQSSVYVIDQALIASMGYDPNTTDPSQVKIAGHGGGMLPQSNAISRSADPPLVPVWISGGGDGSWGAQDYVAFYGESPHRFTYHTESGQYGYQQHLYEDSVYYFISLSETGNSPGLQERASLSGNFSTFSSYQALHVHEEDQFNFLTSGRLWLGEKFELTLSRTITISTPPLAPGGDLAIYTQAAGASFGSSSLEVDVNGWTVSEIEFPSISFLEFQEKAKLENHYANLNTSLAGISGNQVDINLSFNPSNVGSYSRAFLDYLLLVTEHPLDFDSQPLLFQHEATIDAAQATFQVQSAQPVQVWDVTEPQVPVIQQTQAETGGIRFSYASDQLRRFVAWNAETAPRPRVIGEIANQNLKSNTQAEMLIITHERFMTEAQRLAAHRRAHDQLDVLVTPVNQIFNEFASGSKDVTAIRDYIKFLYDSGQQKLKYVLLFGDCSYDYKNRVSVNTNLIPTYQSRNSLHPVDTYSSDDYFGFLEDDEGEWVESQAGDHTLEVGIGRLPVQKTSEAKAIVDKLIHYDLDDSRLGSWRNSLHLIADDGDFNLHLFNSEDLSRTIRDDIPLLNPEKIYVDAYKQIPTSTGAEIAPDVNEALTEAIDQGTLIMNFVGHGNELIWTDEQILDFILMNSWGNLDRLPVFVTATCQFGRYDDPLLQSGGEFLMLKPDGGAIALLTTSRPVRAFTNQRLNKAFYAALSTASKDGNYEMGEIFRVTKNNSLSGPANRNFSFLGDPSMRLALPRYRMQVNDMLHAVTGEPLDTLRALTPVRLSGEVIDASQTPVSSFNGLATLTLFDKPIEKRTLGNESSPTTYQDLDNALYRGQVRVNNGKFEAEFILPKSIDFSFGAGKLTMYAASDNGQSDAGGALSSLVIGGSETGTMPDNNPPEITLFIGDSTLYSEIMPPNTRLMALFYDESGINISNRGIGQGITATLDDSIQFDLTEYYITQTDDYQQGTVLFPLNGLKSGEHQLEVKAFDTYNNLGKARLDFFVGESGNLIIKDLVNYPNPVRDRTQFTFRHNQPGDNLTIWIRIYDRSGSLVKTLMHEINNATSLINDLEWDGNSDSGSPLVNGLYPYTLEVHTSRNGAKNRSFNKLLILK